MIGTTIDVNGDDNDFITITDSNGYYEASVPPVL